MKSWLDGIKTVLFTKRCGLCGDVIVFDAELCEECSKLKRIESPVCKKCGAEKKRCRCRSNSRNVDYNGIAAAYYYEGSIARGALNFKMHNMPGLAKRQGLELSKAIKSIFADINFDFIAYIPMLEKDEARRGFNQAKLLADAVSAECNIPVVNALYKKRRTKMQKRQKASERFANMYNVFGVNDETALSGKCILLIDDVKTTGSTLSSAALTLKAYGAAKVYCAVVSVVAK